MSSRFAPILFCAASLAATAAAAQPSSPPAAKPAPSTTVAPVTVQGASPKVITTQARVFVDTHAMAPNPEIGQISRWHGPVCVQVEGLAQAAQAGQVKARIEEVARSVGLPASGAGCTANVEIVFSDNPQAIMDEVAKSREDLLGYYHRTERDRLKVVNRPLQAWYKTATGSDRNNGGTVTMTYENPFPPNDPSPAATNPVRNVPDLKGRVAANAIVDDPENQSPTGCGDAPHFTSCMTSQFQNVFIVVDSKALAAKGVGLGRAADYLTLLALSQPKALDGCASLPSILDLTAKTACPGRDAPDGLTEADAAWLTALYASDPEAKGDGERTEIASRMADMLIKTSAPAGRR
jgi:hypothetical protein